MARTCDSVSTWPGSCDSFASSAFSLLAKVCRSCRNQTLRTPLGDANNPRLVSSLAIRTCPNAGCSHRQLHNRLFDVRLGSVLQTWLPPADLLQRQLAALLVQFFEPVEAIARVAHHLASLGNTAEHVGKVQKAHFVLDDLLIGVH